jgi:hypothetical protein
MAVLGLGQTPHPTSVLSLRGGGIAAALRGATTSLYVAFALGASGRCLHGRDRSFGSRRRVAPSAFAGARNPDNAT